MHCKLLYRLNHSFATEWMGSGRQMRTRGVHTGRKSVRIKGCSCARYVTIHIRYVATKVRMRAVRMVLGDGSGQRLRGHLQGTYTWWGPLGTKRAAQTARAATATRTARTGKRDDMGGGRGVGGGALMQTVMDGYKRTQRRRLSPSAPGPLAMAFDVPEAQIIALFSQTLLFGQSPSPPPRPR
jgi:hypothetical protein